MTLDDFVDLAKEHGGASGATTQELEIMEQFLPTYKNMSLSKIMKLKE